MAKRVHHLWPVAQSERHSSPFENHRDAAIALLSGEYRLTRKAGQFLGQIAVDPQPLTELQAGWVAKLLKQAKLPALLTASAL